MKPSLMKPMTSTMAIFLLLIFTCCAIAETKITADSFAEVAPGVFVRFGTHEEISRTTVPAIANHGFVVGENSVAIIDPGGSLHTAQSTLEVIDRLIGLPVSHVIVTHMHPDHSLGLLAYSKVDELIILGHAELTNSLLANLEFFAEHFVTSENIAQLDALLRAQRIQSIDANHDIDLGNRPLLLTSFDSAHSTSDITVLDETHKLLWAGDLLFVERLPVVSGSLPGWVAALERIDNMDISTVIPGHGSSGPWHSLVKPQRKYLSDLLEDTRTAIADGQSLHDYIKAAADSSNDNQWQLFGSQHKTNLTRAYIELEWE